LAIWYKAGKSIAAAAAAAAAPRRGAWDDRTRGAFTSSTDGRCRDPSTWTTFGWHRLMASAVVFPFGPVETT
jgi:hypothetical protein